MRAAHRFLQPRAQLRVSLGCGLEDKKGIFALAANTLFLFSLKKRKLKVDMHARGLNPTKGTVV